MPTGFMYRNLWAGKPVGSERTRSVVSSRVSGIERPRSTRLASHMCSAWSCSYWRSMLLIFSAVYRDKHCRWKECCDNTSDRTREDSYVARLLRDLSLHLAVDKARVFAVLGLNYTTPTRSG